MKGYCAMSTQQKMVFVILRYFWERSQLEMQDTSMTLWIMPSTPNPVDAIEAKIAGFEAANPGVTVEYEILDWDSAWTHITNATASGEGSEVSQIGSTWVSAIHAMEAPYHFNNEDMTAVHADTDTLS
jgi:ABC-type glycerol-3-phosphate transport system substrate-binding protein